MIRPRINFVTLGVADVAQARAFYERLGLVAAKAGDQDVAFFDANGVVLAVFRRSSLAEDAGLDDTTPPSFRGCALAWNAASEAEADRIMAQAEGAGAMIVKKLQKAFWGGYSGYFADPDGHLWEVAYNPYFPLDEHGRIELP
jgi:uncharacterized protein